MSESSGRWAWVNSTVLAIVLATFFSDVSHELATAVLPLYLLSIGLGPAALGLLEGLGDFLLSLSKLGGGIVGHHVRHKRVWCSLGYLVTALGTASMGLVQGLAGLLTLRSLAWIGRGFRSPLRDALLAENVAATHYGRAYGLERAADMLGAVGGQVLAIGLLWAGYPLSTILLGAILPGLLAAGALYFLAKDQPPAVSGAAETPRSPRQFPPGFYWFLAGVLLFGLGDFSRSFLILLAATALGASEVTPGVLTVSVTLYLMHNLVSALAAYPIGSLADRWARMPVLLLGYGLGVVTNLLLAFWYGWFPGLIAAVVLSGIYIAVEETVEKSTAAQLLPPEMRSLGFGILASVNAVGDMISSVGVGLLLQAGQGTLAFGLAAGVGLAGLVWLLVFRARIQTPIR